MYCTEPTRQKARVQHVCTNCGHPIAIGEEYDRWMSIDDKAFTNKMHIECLQALNDEASYYGGGGFEYMPYSGEPPERLRPAPGSLKGE